MTPHNTYMATLDVLDCIMYDSNRKIINYICFLYANF